MKKLSITILFLATTLCGPACSQHRAESPGATSESAERQRAEPAPPDSPTVDVPPAAAWRDRARWREMRVGMTEDEVRALFGEPEAQQTVGGQILWDWGNPVSARVYFSKGRVSGWDPY